MGTDEHDQDERPSRRVYFDEFHIGVHAVTNEELRSFRPGHWTSVASHPGSSGRRAPRSDSDVPGARSFSSAWTDGTAPAGRTQHPVTMVTFEDAVMYCAWLESSTGNPFRLPTEAEWEKAARGGLERQRFPWGDEIDPSRANYLPDPNIKLRHGTTEVTAHPRTAIRCTEWPATSGNGCRIGMQPTTMPAVKYSIPPGPAAGDFRVVRGGSWVNNDTNFLRCARRHPVPVRQLLLQHWFSGSVPNLQAEDAA